MTFGERIRAERKRLGWSQTTTAEKLGLGGHATYANYEQGVREPNMDVLSKMADLFGVTVDYLLGRAPEAPSGSPAPDQLLPQLLAHLTRIEQSVVEMRADIRALKEITQAGAQLAERIDATETDIKLLKMAVTKK